MSANDSALPLTIRDVSPGPGAIRLTGVRPDGLPDGVHTGGAWLWGEGEVWKPLDGRPHPTAGAHFPTQDDVVLGVMAGAPLFPRNWTVEERGGRRFLVRAVAQIFPRDLPWSTLSEADALLVERGVRALNEAGWEIGDPVSLGRDPEGRLFLVDLSNAHFIASHVHGADDLWRLDRFFQEAGFERLLRFRGLARTVIAPCRFLMAHRGYVHVYACPQPEVYACPQPDAAASVPGALYVSAEAAAQALPPRMQAAHLAQYLALGHGWLVTAAPLSDADQTRLGLTWGWSPLARS